MAPWKHIRFPKLLFNSSRSIPGQVHCTGFNTSMPISTKSGMNGVSILFFTQKKLKNIFILK